MNNKLIRITTKPISLAKLIKGQMAFMKSYYEVIAISSGSESLKNVGHNEGIATFSLEMTRRITPVADVKSVYILYKFLKKEKPFIVHTHTPKAGIVGMIAAFLALVPNRLHTVAGLPLLEAKGFKRFVLNSVERITYACATKIYPNSVGLKKIILDNNFTSKKKLKVIANGSSNGIDTSYFNAELFSEEVKQTLRNKLKIQKDDFVFMFVGRIVGDKGINELINVFNKLSKDNKKIKLLLVGPFEEELDPLQEQTKKIIDENKQIISMGYQNDVRPYLAISSVLTFPSYREGFPNVVMQAGAMGLPSIVTNINGCNEIIIEGENGWIIPVKDKKALFKAMKSCLLNKDSYNFAKNNARRLIVDRYEQKVVWEAILKEYQSLEKNV